MGFLFKIYEFVVINPERPTIGPRVKFLTCRIFPWFALAWKFERGGVWIGTTRVEEKQEVKNVTKTGNPEQQ
jgi:hypothetical protein